MNEISWSYSGSGRHSITADDSSYDSGPRCPPDCLAPTRYVNQPTGGSEVFYSFIYDFATRVPGTYRYYCKIHGGPGGSGMSGLVVITDDV